MPRPSFSQVEGEFFYIIRKVRPMIQNPPGMCAFYHGKENRDYAGL